MLGFESMVTPPGLGVRDGQTKGPVAAHVHRSGYRLSHVTA